MGGRGIYAASRPSPSTATKLTGGLPFVAVHNRGHWITSSARNDCGAVIPGALAVLRLDHHIEFRRLLDRQVAGFRASKNITNVSNCTPHQHQQICPAPYVIRPPSSTNSLRPYIIGKAVSCRQVHGLCWHIEGERIFNNNHGLRTLSLAISSAF